MTLNEWLCKNVLGWKTSKHCFERIPDFANDKAACMDLFEAMCKNRKCRGYIELWRNDWSVALGDSFCCTDANLCAAILSIGRRIAVNNGWKETDDEKSG